MHRRLYLLTFLLAISAASAERVPITRDTWVTNHRSQMNANLGGASNLKLKSNQEMSLIDIDPAPLRGRTITKATLHLHVSGKERLHRVTVSSVASEWTEGDSPRYATQNGSSSFAHRAHPDKPWAEPGSDLCSVVLGAGGTLWSTADASAPDAKGWQEIAVDPRVIGARVASVSQGFLLFDDTGSEWTRDGENFSYRLFPNRYVNSRDAGASKAPYFSLEFGPDDHQAPPPVAEFAIETKGLPAGEALVSWDTPPGAVGFAVTVNGKIVPRYLLPAPKPRARLHIRDLRVKSGAAIILAVAVLDGAGNRSRFTRQNLRVSDQALPDLPGKPAEFAKRPSPAPRLGSASISIVDALDKISKTGVRSPQQPDAYLQANHLWNGGRIQLSAARNEFVAFQILVKGDVRGLQATLNLGDSDIEFGELRSIGGWPDAVLPLQKPLNISGGASLLCDIYVPHSAAGPQSGKLTLRDAAGSRLEIPVELNLWNFTLPDHLSFFPEMNCYRLPANERDYYRLAHRHRTPLNRVPYGQDGKPDDGAVPIWRDGKLDFRAWDQRFGPLLDGSAFADLPRKGVPLTCFYLPMHENWPGRIEDHYNGDYWADRAFTAEFREAFVAVSQQFAAHADAKGWHDTRFHCYQNNKVNFKERGWSRGSSPWLLDEPANWQDYTALRFFASAFHEGVRRAGGNAHMWYRGDISRPQWERDSLDGLLEYYVLGGRAFRQYDRMVFDRKRADGRIAVTYGSANALDASNMQAVGWCLDAWTRGADGVIPWQTIGRQESWKKPDRLSLFYPGPVPSIRLKAFRRGQQDVEYLTLLTQVLDAPRWAVGQRVREALGLQGTVRGTGFAGEDAGVIEYSDLRPDAAWALRMQIGAALSKAAPPARSRLLELRTPPRQPDPQSHFVGPVRASPKWTPKAAPANPVNSATRVILQGRDVVRDAIISPYQADATLGGEGRSNRLLRSPQASAMLLSFRLKKTWPSARLRRAILRFHVWDPSNKGRAKVVAAPLLRPWSEAQASWGRGWSKGAFVFGADTGPSVGSVVVAPDVGSDTANPPIPYDVDVTDAVRAWLQGKPNHGLALTTLADRAIDDGHNTRFQVYASEHRDAKYGPSLSLEFD